MDKAIMAEHQLWGIIQGTFGSRPIVDGYMRCVVGSNNIIYEALQTFPYLYAVQKVKRMFGAFYEKLVLWTAELSC